MARFRVARMQTNADWTSPTIVFRAGTPPAPIDTAGWTIAGVAVGTAGRLDLTLGARLTLNGSGQLTIRLAAADCAALGAGRVDFEIMRLSPEPAPRPLLRFAMTNHPGVL